MLAVAQFKAPMLAVLIGRTMRIKSHLNKLFKNPNDFGDSPVFLLQVIAKFIARKILIIIITKNKDKLITTNMGIPRFKVVFLGYNKSIE